MYYCQQRREIVLTSKLVTPSVTEIVSLANFKIHAKVDGTDEDAIIPYYINTATEEATNYTRRVLMTGAWSTKVDYFPSVLTLDVVPVVLASIVVKYLDVNNVSQTLASSEYFIRDTGDDSYLKIEFDGTIPETYDVENAVTIEYNAGYPTIPSTIYDWILNRAVSLYENRQSQVLGQVAHDVYGFAPLFPYKML